MTIRATLRRAAACLSCLACLLPGTVGAGSHGASPSAGAPLATVAILPGWARSDGLYMAAIDIVLEPGWKTYWRAPGSAGFAPVLDWSGSRNLSQVGYFWPSPSVFDTYGARAIGYQDRLVLPVLLRPEDPGQPIHAHLSMDFGVCETICVPAFATVEAVLPVAETHNAELIQEWVSRRPLSARDAGVVERSCDLLPSGDGFRLSASLEFANAPTAPGAVVIEGPGTDTWISEPDISVEGRQLRLESDLVHYGDEPFAFERSGIRITLIGADRTIDVQGCD